MCCVYNNNFTLSIGAAMVFANAPDIPPAKKSYKKFYDPLDEECAIFN